MAKPAKAESKAKPKAKKAPKLDALHGELAQRLEDVVALIDRMGGGVKSGDCDKSLQNLAHAQSLFRDAGRVLSRASKLDEQLRRRIRAGGGDARERSAAPAEAAPSRAPASCPVDREECAFNVDGGACTISAALALPARGGGIGTERIPARYCLVEITQLRTSHEPLRGFEPRDDYPPVAQERDYRQTAERAKVEEIANHYDPALIFNTSPGALDGPPVVTEGRVVLGGNGRTMASALVYAGRAAVEPGVIRQYLVEHAHEFGLDPDLVARFAAPIVVRTVRVSEEPRTLAEWSRRLNVSLSQQLDATRLAVSRARFVDDSVLRELAAMEDEETLAAFLSSNRSRGFVRALQRSGIIDGRAAAVYLSEGLLNEPGRNLVADLLVAVLVPDADLIGAFGRAAVAALARSAPAFVRATEWPEYDLRPAIRKAIRDRITMGAQGIRKVADFLAQGGLFASAAAASAGDPLAVGMLHVLAELEESPAKLTKFARRYVALAQPTAAGQAALFAGESLTPIEALRRAAGEVGVKVPS